MQRIMARQGFHQAEMIDGNSPIKGVLLGLTVLGVFLSFDGLHKRSDYHNSLPDTAPIMDDIDDDEQGGLRLDSMMHEDSYGDRRGVYRQVPRQDSTESDSPSRTPANLFDDL